MSLPPSYNLLEKYPNPYFVESGSWRGDAVQQALDANFRDIRTIDIDPANTKFCKYRFDLIPRAGHVMPPVRLYTGDSATCLWDMIRDIPGQITFWLDSHSQLFEDEVELGTPFPLLKELEQIGRHHLRSHTILIDDLLYMTHPHVTGWTLTQIKDAIRAINPAYKFELIANPIKSNLLVAYI